jgi:phosphatidate cytidylyltransferase
MVQAIAVFLTGGFLLGGLLLLAASRAAAPAVRRQRAVKYLAYFLIVMGFCAAALGGRRWLVFLLCMLMLLGLVELVRIYWNSTGKAGNRFPRWIPAALVFLLLGSATVYFASASPPETVLFVYLVTATFDGFSQVFGQWLGKRPLVPRLSPRKTVEGLLGGLAAALLAALLLREAAALSAPQALGTGAAISVAGLAGDLAASWVKRRNGAKDFGTLLPGHGGILDRFDSFFVAAPTYLLFSLANRISL